MKTPEGRLVWTGDKDLTMYTNFFERYLMQQITGEYDQMCAEWRRSLSPADYLLQVINLSMRESNFGATMLQE